MLADRRLQTPKIHPSADTTNKSRRSNRPATDATAARLRAEIDRMRESGVVRSLNELCKQAGTYQAFPYWTRPELREFYLETCSKMGPSSVDLTAAKLKAEIEQMLESGTIEPLSELCKRAGTYQSFPYNTVPALKEFYLETCLKLKPQKSVHSGSSTLPQEKAPQSRAPLPVELRETLRRAATANLTKPSLSNGKKLTKVIHEVSRALGFDPQDADAWNRTIDTLDANYPGWRGYEVQYVDGKVA